jgi:pyruvate/2-oxoglutarate dehydrogenase complex dihydrolipoamide dehydrogenase (E3) component
MRDAQSWGQFGLRGDAPQVDIATTLANAERVANYEHQQRRVAEVIASQGIDLIEEAGPARFVDPHTVRIWIRANQYTPGPITCGVCGQAFQP